jgi:hypothetical protein
MSAKNEDETPVTREQQQGICRMDAVTIAEQAR